jgi:hypothetical protein
VSALKKELHKVYKDCRKLKSNDVSEAIKSLPEPLKCAVLACLTAAKRKGPKGNRYEKEWIYEAMLMRIKSPTLYEHIRSHKILPLPSRTILNLYMSKLHPTYGYQKPLFDVLKAKISDWDEKDRHGKSLHKILMVFEIKQNVFKI